MTATPPHITLGSVPELLQAVPYLVGYHPRHSIVVIGFGDGGHGPARFTACAGLPDDSPSGLPVRVDMLRRNKVDTLLLVAYDLGGDADAILRRLVDSYRQAGIDVPDAVRVADGRWWSHACADYCPPEGFACESRDDVSAQFVLGGAVALDSRDQKLAQLAPAAGEAARAVADARRDVRD
ncbi:MAG: DUF4192 domain-containing protein, partial [Stackebrandtia sp.]